jgi:hypothetical protein
MADSAPAGIPKVPTTSPGPRMIKKLERLQARRGEFGSVRTNRRAGPTAKTSVWQRGYLNCGSRNQQVSIVPPEPINQTGQTDWVAWRPWLYFKGYGWYPGDWEGWFPVPAYTTLSSVGAIPLGFMPRGLNLHIAGALTMWWWNSWSGTTDIFGVNVSDFGWASNGPYFCVIP